MLDVFPRAEEMQLAHKYMELGACDKILESARCRRRLNFGRVNLATGKVLTGEKHRPSLENGGKKLALKSSKDHRP